MTLYENVVIGNFLFGLGCALGARLSSRPIPGSVNLLQQTPEDKVLGDVLLSFPGTVRLLEFKASGASLRKEREKHRVLAKAIVGRQDLEAASRQIHWYVKSAPASGSGLGVFYAPYLDAVMLRTSKRHRNAAGLQMLIDGVVNDVLSDRGLDNPKCVSDYLTLLRWIQSGDDAKSSGAGALIFVVGTDGALHYAQLHNLAELLLTRKQWFELQRERMQERDLALGLNRGMTRDHSLHERRENAAGMER